MRSIQQSIKVMARIRPPSNCIIYRDERNSNVLHCADREHILDHIFTAEDTNDDILQKVGYELVSNTLEGYNSTLFVYGHTGSGKTFTMNGTMHEEGLIYKTFKLLHKMLQNQEKYECYSIKMSYIEIYNQEVKDLLGVNKVTVRLKMDKGFYIQGLEQCELQSVDDFQRVFRKGIHNRKTGTTKMNSDSSRSHAILTFSIETKQLVELSTVCRSSKLNFVDLAGAERLKQTEALGERKSEAVKINTSLSVLTRVINLLAANKTKQQNNVIPYRQSVLTMILKDSLGGNSHTIIIGTLHNNIKSLSNTVDILATLEFLERAKKVKNLKKVNQKLQGNEQRLKQKVSQYQTEITSLKQEIQTLKTKLEEANQIIQVYSEEIKGLKLRILSNQTPIFQLFEETEPYFLNKTPFQNTYKDDLPVIIQETHSNKSEKGEINTVHQTKSQSLPSMRHDSEFRSEKGSLRSMKNFNEKLLRLQNQSLKEKIRNLQRFQYQEQQILKLINKNIDRFDFDEVQLNILEAQYKKIQALERQLKRSEIYCQRLLPQFELQKSIFMSKYEVIECVSERSVQILAEKKLTSNIAHLTSKVEKLEEERNGLVQSNKVQMLKMEEQIDELKDDVRRWQIKYQCLQKNYSKLQMCLEETQKQQREMDKLLEDHRAALVQDNDFTEIIKQLNLTNQEELETLINEIDSLNQRIAKTNEEKLELELESQHLKKELQVKRKEIQDLKEEVQAGQKVISHFQEQYIKLDEFDSLKSHCLEIEEQLKKVKQVLENVRVCLSVVMEDSEMTVEGLVAKYLTNKARMEQLQETNSNQSVKNIELQAALQMQKCRLNVFTNASQKRQEESKKLLMQKDSEIEGLKQNLDKLLAKVAFGQTPTENSQIFESEQKKINAYSQQMSVIYSKFEELQSENIWLKEQNQQLSTRLQSLSNLQSNYEALAEQNQKIKRKNTTLKTEALNYSQWMMKQLQSYHNSVIAKACQIKKLKKNAQDYQNEAKRLRESAKTQVTEEELNKVKQEDKKKQWKINQLQTRLKQMLIENQDSMQIIRQYRFKTNELNEEVARLKGELEEQYREHMLEVSSIRSKHINFLLDKEKTQLNALLKRNKPKQECQQN